MISDHPRDGRDRRSNSGSRLGRGDEGSELTRSAQGSRERSERTNLSGDDDVMNSSADSFNELLWDIGVLAAFRLGVIVTIDVHGVVPLHIDILVLLLKVPLSDAAHHCFLGSTDPGTADVAVVFGVRVGTSWLISLVGGEDTTMLILDFELALWGGKEEETSTQRAGNSRHPP